jgi:hypothetical protein
VAGSTKREARNAAAVAWCLALAMVSAALVSLTAVATSQAGRSMNACVLVTSAEATGVLGASTRILPGEGTASCNIFRGNKVVGIISAYPETRATYDAFRRTLPRARVRALPAIHVSAYLLTGISSPFTRKSDGFAVFVYDGGHRLRILSHLPVLLTPTRAQQLARIAVRRA